MRKLTFAILLALATCTMAFGKAKQATFPDGTPISTWFADTTRTELAQMGKQYVITDYGVVNDSTVLQTEKYRRSSTFAIKMVVA